MDHTLDLSAIPICGDEFHICRTAGYVTSGSLFINGFRHRAGVLHLPFDEALEVAQKFFAAEP